MSSVRLPCWFDLPGGFFPSKIRCLQTAATLVFDIVNEVRSRDKGASRRTRLCSLNSASRHPSTTEVSSPSQPHGEWHQVGGLGRHGCNSLTISPCIHADTSSPWPYQYSSYQFTPVSLGLLPSPICASSGGSGKMAIMISSSAIRRFWSCRPWIYKTTLSR